MLSQRLETQSDFLCVRGFPVSSGPFWEGDVTGLKLLPLHPSQFIGHLIIVI